MAKLPRAIGSKESLKKLFKSIKFGGLTLVENYSSMGTELTIYSILNYSREVGFPVLIEDIFDTLSVHLKHLKLLGVTPPMDHVGVMKVGGKEKTENTIEHIPFEMDPTLYIRKRENAISRAMGDERYLHIVLGMERFSVFQRDMVNFRPVVSNLRQSLGDSKRITINIVEAPVMESLEFNPLPVLEGIATSVVRLYDQGELLKVIFKKSIFTLVSGRGDTLVSPREVLSWW